MINAPSPPDGLTDASHPSGHLARGVHVMGLHVLGEALLGLQVELHHRVGERVGVGPGNESYDHIPLPIAASRHTQRGRPWCAPL